MAVRKRGSRWQIDFRIRTIRYCITDNVIKCKGHKAILALALSVAARVKDETLDVAAKVADGLDMPCSPRTEAEQTAPYIAEGIRRLKTKAS